MRLDLMEFFLTMTELTAEERAQGRRNKIFLLGGVLLLVVVLSAAMAVGYATAPDENVRFLTDQGHQHIDGPIPDYVYNTLPPASGPHVPELVTWGEHIEMIPNWQQLHNLEQGGVIIHYDCSDGCPDVVAELRAIMAEAGEDLLILHPYPDMDHQIVLTAWARMLSLDEVDRDAILDFIERFRGIDHAP